MARLASVIGESRIACLSHVFDLKSKWKSNWNYKQTTWKLKLHKKLPASAMLLVNLFLWPVSAMLLVSNQNESQIETKCKLIKIWFENIYQTKSLASTMRHWWISPYDEYWLRRSNWKSNWNHMKTNQNVIWKLSNQTNFFKNVY